jgi:putative colanic acid biosynthesis UDP-glucose lipid carrier transferase
MGNDDSLPPFAALLNTLLCPGVIVAILVLCVFAYGEPFSGHYLALAVLGFLISSQVLDDIDFFVPWGIPELARVTRSVVLRWAAVVGMLFFLGYATKMNDQFDYDVILTWFAVTPFALLASVKVARTVVRRVINTGSMTRGAVIVGAHDLGRAFAGRLNENPYFNIRFWGFFYDRLPERLGYSGTGLLGRIADVPDYVGRHRISCVYIALPMAAQPRIVRLIQELRDTTASVYFLPDFSVFDLVQARFDCHRGIPVVAICETPFYGVNAVVKRVMDLTLAAAIVVLVAPVMLVVAAAVKIDSRGPILFRQRRYGIDGSEMVIFKFRTMVVSEDGERVVQAQRNDPRVTRLGAFLRRTSLDELPQFFNVLGGSMSIVGPRPHAVAHNEQYRKLIPGYMRRHKAKPGITGWAQINGFRGETETVDKMQKRVDLDMAYLNNWSPSLDLWIIIRTLSSVWGNKKAY